MYENQKDGSKESSSEFEKLLNQLDTAIGRQHVIIMDIAKRANSLIEPLKESCAGDCEKEGNPGGLVGEFKSRITKVLDHNKELEYIDDVLRRVVG